MTSPLAVTSAPAVGCAAARLHARRLSSQAATCSYAAPQHRKRVRDSTACRAAQTEVVEEPETGEVEEVLSEDLLKLLGPRTVPTPVLSPAEVLDSLYNRIHDNATEHYHAFYSSELQGITTDPALMVVHMDDHLVHRGHAVFDTAVIVDGFLYQLWEHLQRFQASAEAAGILLPFSIDQIHRIICETAAASRQINGHVKYWLGAGRGSFGLSGTECVRPSFYCQVYTTPLANVNTERYMTVKTSPVPIKPSFFATLKSTNYLPNVLTVMDAQADGLDQGIFVDEDGMVAEGANTNIGIITHDNEIVVPPFDNSLPGITIMTLMELIPEVIGTDDLLHVDRVVQRHFSVEEAKAAREVFVAGSSLPILPVVVWDDVSIGEGVPGRGVMSLKALLMNHMNPANNKGQHVEVPYGWLTGAE